MSRRLIAHVYVDGIAYGPDDEVPAAVARRIGAHAWTSGEDAGGPPGVPGTDGGAEPPPRSGRGSGIEAWRAFAEQHKVEVATDASREDIIAAAESAGVVEPEQPKD
ncbi:hypothetical protein [Streptomyces alboflavus]|uniref:hypothetical protein n=1 Tax=Streptomyces alboflavus TaxID=67267 RepID=UPI000F6564FE|nr:hypothetical protein [Streptomyces alboflavus]